jgi:GLPGLI family protein
MQGDIRALTIKTFRMKYTTVMQKALLTFLCCCLTMGSLFAQRLVSDAKIVYKIETPEADAAFEGGTLTQYMKGHLSRVDIDFKVVHYSYLINSKDESVVTLINNHGDKYLIRTGKEEYTKELREYTQVQFKDAGETKQIAGYNCKKAIGKMQDGKTFEVYYTTDLLPENKQYNRRFINLKGIPLEFEIINKNGSKMHMIAQKVDLYAVPGSFFDVPKTGYKEISKEELKKMGS